MKKFLVSEGYQFQPIPGGEVPEGEELFMFECVETLKKYL